MRRGNARRWWIGVIIALVVLLAVEIPLAVGVLHPRIDAVPDGVDAVYAIGPADDHMAQARALMKQTGASTLVVTISVDPRTGTQYRKDFCDPSPDWKVICLVPDPYTTRGEASTLRRLVATYGWRHVVVLTDKPHVTRTRLWMDKCVPVPVTVVAASAGAAGGAGLVGVLYQSAGWVAGQVQGCP